ncbi:MAG: glycosyltransferase family 2 protein [Betaproteobacteria bacterium]
MRVRGAIGVRNGADVIEAAVRHNLAAMDGVVVLAHGATDATPAILDALVAEGLPVTVVRDDDPAPEPTALAARLLREGFADGTADWVIVLDAADFLRPASRQAVLRAMTGADVAVPVAIPCATYVPDFALPGTDASSDPPAPLAAARRLAVEPHPATRLAASRSFAGREAEALATRRAPVAASVLAVARVPVRSREQLVADCTVGRLAALAAGRPEPDGSWVDAVYREARAGRPLPPAFVDAAAVNAGAARAQWVDPATVARVDDPFLAPVALSHTPPRAPFPLAQVLALGERLARSEAVRAQAQLLHGADAGAALARPATGQGPPR